ncbi:hypothetical protein HORM4_510017 [Vibrio harveyi]|nr:hypothetical protein HORM4_510017 [Vibrio harveyi]
MHSDMSGFRPSLTVQFCDVGRQKYLRVTRYFKEVALEEDKNWSP